MVKNFFLAIEQTFAKLNSTISQSKNNINLNCYETTFDAITRSFDASSQRG